MRPGADYLRAQYSELAEAASRALGVQGPLLDAIDPAYSPGITMLDLHQPDMLWLRRQTRFLSGQNLNAAAGNNSVIELENPAGSQMLMTVRVSVFNNNAAAQFMSLVCAGPARLAGGVATRSCNADQRQPFNLGALAPFPTALIRAQNLVLAVGNGPVIYLGIGGNYTFPPVILPPGAAVSTQPTTGVNIGNVTLFEWTERQQQPMEL